MKPSNFLINVLVKERVWGMEGEVHTFNTPLQVIKNTREHEPSPLPSGSQVRPGHLEDTVRRPCPKRSFFSDYQSTGYFLSDFLPREIGRWRKYVFFASNIQRFLFIGWLLEGILRGNAKTR